MKTLALGRSRLRRFQSQRAALLEVAHCMLKGRINRIQSLSSWTRIMNLKCFKSNIQSLCKCFLNDRRRELLIGTLKTIHVINSSLISLPISISHCLQAAKHTHIKRLQLIGHFLWHKNDINVQLLCTLQHWRSPVTAIVIKDESTRS